MQNQTKIIPALSVKDQLHNALIDIQTYKAGLVIESDKSHREFIGDFLQSKINLAEELLSQLVEDTAAVTEAQIKRATAEVMAKITSPTYSRSLWSDVELYKWLAENDCVWLPSRKDWINLSLVADTTMWLEALKVIYAEEGDIDTRYFIPSMASLKAQSLDYYWNRVTKEWVKES